MTILEQLDSAHPGWRRQWSDPLDAAVDLGLIDADAAQQSDEDEALLPPLRFTADSRDALYGWDEYAFYTDTLPLDDTN